MQTAQISAEDGVFDVLGGAEAIENGGLAVVDVADPPTRKERGVGAKQEAIGAGDLDGLFKDLFEGGGWSEAAGPPVGAGGIEVDIGAEGGEHEGLAEVACAEVGDDEGEAGVAAGDGVEVDGVGEAEVEEGGEAEAFAEADGEHAAVDEDDGAGLAGGDFDDGAGFGAGDGEAVHGGEEADAAEAGLEGEGGALDGIGGEGVEEEIAGEAGREGLDGGGDGGFIAGQGSDEGGAGDGMTVEFGGPEGGEFGGVLRGEGPAEFGANGFGGGTGAFLLGEEGEEVMGEEVEVGVEDGSGHGERVNCRPRKYRGGRERRGTRERGRVRRRGRVE